MLEVGAMAYEHLFGNARAELEFNVEKFLLYARGWLLQGAAEDLSVVTLLRAILDPAGAIRYPSYDSCW